MGEEEEVYLGAIRETFLGKEPPNIPFSIIRKWTNDFTNKIGEGAFGEVYEGSFIHKQSSNNRTRTSFEAHGLTRVAVKKMSSTLRFGCKDAQMLFDSFSCLKREINVLRLFRHPNIIRLLGYSIPEGIAKIIIANNSTLTHPSSESLKLCLVYELAVNGDLAKHLLDDEKAAQLDWPRRLSTALGIASALNFLHSLEPSNPAFHRDVKSANVVFTADWIPKLIDCGLAKYLPGPSPSEVIMSVYSSPGQLLGTFASTHTQPHIPPFATCPSPLVSCAVLL